MAYFSVTKETSLQDILTQTNLSYATLYTRLKSITRDGLLLRRRAGWRHLFRLNPAHPVVQKHLELVEVARCSTYLSGHPKRETVLALLEEGAAATPLLTAFLLNGHAHAPAGPVPAGSNGTSNGGDGGAHVGVAPPSSVAGVEGASSPPPRPQARPPSPAPAGPTPSSPGASLRDAPAGSAPQPPGASLRDAPAGNGNEEHGPFYDAEMVFVVTEPEFAPRIAKLAPKGQAAGLRVRVQTPAEFRALVPYLNGSVPLVGTDFFIREKLKITFPSGDFAVQAGNGLLAVFVAQPEREFTIREIQALARRSYKPTYFGLQKLLGWGLLGHRREKWKHYFRLNLANPVVRKHLELEELRKGRASLANLPSAERLAVGTLVTKAVQAIPLLAILHRQSREGPTLYFVVQKRNGHGQALQPLWAAANLPSLKPRLIEVKNLRSLLGRGQNHFGVLYGEEFYLTQKLKAITNGNGHGPEPASESPGSGLGSPPAAAVANP